MVAPENALRVAVLSDTLPPLANGGIATAHFNLIQALRGAGHTVKAFTFHEHAAVLPADEVDRRRYPRWLEYPVKALLMTAFRLHGLWALKTAHIGTVLEFSDALFGALNGLRLVLPLCRFNPRVIVVPDKGA